MKIDIGFKTKGLFNTAFRYDNVRDYQVTIIEDIIVIKFYHTKKGKERYFEFQILKNNLEALVVRKRIEIGD
jgi:hypothetical protein